ncbi:MAG: endolytic transglycosylase MltG, partial [Pseudomonadota bacterium]|nr:endolytic transglycosylase MltG [Pseudomonadota bacterium]
KRILGLLMAGKTALRQVTIPEGLMVSEVVAILDVAPALEGTTPVPPEGSILPETYSYQFGETRAEVLNRMSKAMQHLLADLWANRKPGLPFKDPIEAVILASIVERETGVAEERSRVAGVFVNRLRRGMRLQSDPTVAYAATNGKQPLGRPLTRKDLDAAHPYNTYWIKGLPPSPISNPGRAALAATLNPLETDELYFVADGTGGHAFAKTLAEHNRNVAKWRKLQRERKK